MVIRPIKLKKKLNLIEINYKYFLEEIPTSVFILPPVLNIIRKYIYTELVISSRKYFINCKMLQLLNNVFTNIPS